jgi:hypothetical protein
LLPWRKFKASSASFMPPQIRARFQRICADAFSRFHRTRRMRLHSSLAAATAWCHRARIFSPVCLPPCIGLQKRVTCLPPRHSTLACGHLSRCFPKPVIQHPSNKRYIVLLGMHPDVRLPLVGPDAAEKEALFDALTALTESRTQAQAV